MVEVPLLCPVKPHELSKPMRRRLTGIAERVAGAAVIHNQGRDLLLLIYTAGLFHGVEFMKRGETK